MRLVLLLASQKMSISGFKRLELEEAVARNDVIEVDRLISLKADINSKDCNGETPLHKAAFANRDYSHQTVIYLLLKNCADVNAQNEQGETPLHKSISKSNPQVVELLLNFHAYVDAKDNYGRTALYLAAYENNFEIVQLLANSGANVNVHVTDSPVTPLHLASTAMNEKMIKCLLDHGADIHARDLQGRISLMLYAGNLRYKKKHSTNHKVEKEMLKILLECSDLSINSEVAGTGYEYLIINRCYEWTWELIFEQVAKWKIVNLSVHPSLPNIIKNNDDNRQYFFQCEEELSLAKNTKFKNSWITYLNVLMDDPTKLKNYAGNEDLLQDFKKGLWTDEFPIFGLLMQANMKKGIETRKLFNKSASSMSNYCPIFGPTHLIIRDLLDCLNFEDYQTLLK